MVKYFRKETRTFGRRARQRNTTTSRNRETRHNAAGATRRCGLWRRRCAGGRSSPATGLHSIISSLKSPLASSPTSCITCTRRLDFTSAPIHAITCATITPPHPSLQKMGEQAASPELPRSADQCTIERTLPGCPQLGGAQCRNVNRRETKLWIGLARPFTAATPPQFSWSCVPKLEQTWINRCNCR